MIKQPLGNGGLITVRLAEKIRLIYHQDKNPRSHGLNMIEKVTKMLESPVFKVTLGIASLAYSTYMFAIPLMNSTLFDTLHRWQSLNAAIIAFFAALLAIYNTKQAELQKSIKKRKALRAFLPLAILEVQDYLKELRKGLKDVHEDCDPIRLMSRKPPTDAFKKFENFIEHSHPEDQMLVDHLVILISSLQAYEARIKRMLDENARNARTVSEQTLKFTFRASALVEGMFQFARFETDTYNRTQLGTYYLGTGYSPYEVEDLVKQPITLELLTIYWPKPVKEIIAEKVAKGEVRVIAKKKKLCPF
ncbi:hypothetical protein HJ037_11780 [Vibrio parahaemolyticus]|nr:hypothetical protein [Vibrio parahaemolyticus]